MIPLSSAISSGLTWSKLPRNRGYELRRNGQMVGSLQKSGFWSSNFVARTQSGQWTFRRGGCLGTGSAILDAASQRQVATFKSAWGMGGALTFADGQTVRLQCKGWWRPVWSVVGDGGQELLRLHARERTVEVPAATALSEDRLVLLAMFAWYRKLQAEEDAASAAVVAAVAAT